MFVWRDCSWRTCKTSSQLLFVCKVFFFHPVGTSEKCSETGVILAIMLSNLLSFTAFLHGVLVSYGAFVCVLLHFVAFPLRLCLPTCVCNWGHPRHHGAELILYLKERMPCIGLCVDHGTEPGLVHFCDFLAFPLQLCLRTFVCNWGHPVVPRFVSVSV